MPAVDREAVKTLAIAVGVREAARQTGINHNTILSWSKRDKWFAPTLQPPSVIRQNGDAISAIITPSDALAATLADFSKKTRLNLAEGLCKASEVVRKMPGKQVLKQARQVKDIVGSSAQVGGWQDQTQTGPLTLNILTNQAALRFNAPPLPEKGVSE